jgi:hypothetical protein
MRHSKLALVLIRLNVDSIPHQLLIHHRKWQDWTLVGGHVEPYEKNDWARAAERECNEELSPLQFGIDFTLLPLLDRPIQWGPTPSKSANNEPTVYTAQLFSLRFIKSPMECIARLPSGEFKLVSEQDIAAESALGKADLPTRLLNAVSRPILAWDKIVPSAEFTSAMAV